MLIVVDMLNDDTPCQQRIKLMRLWPNISTTFSQRVVGGTTAATATLHCLRGTYPSAFWTQQFAIADLHQRIDGANAEQD